MITVEAFLILSTFIFALFIIGYPEIAKAGPTNATLISVSVAICFIVGLHYLTNMSIF